MFKEKLCLDNVQIERAHRVKNKQNKDKKTKPATIVCKILSYKQKREVLKNANKLQGTDIFINEDFCHETMQHRKQFVIFNRLSCCFEETIGFDVKTSFASRPKSRLIR